MCEVICSKQFQNFTLQRLAVTLNMILLTADGKFHLGTGGQLYSIEKLEVVVCVIQHCDGKLSRE